MAILFKLVITIFSFFGIKAALLRAYKTYASGSVRQSSVTEIVPQHNGISQSEARQTNNFFTLLNQNVKDMLDPVLDLTRGRRMEG